jgi:UDP-N-acetylmuramate dehydrogenase
MNADRFESGARAVLGPSHLTAHAPLAPLTSFHIGGPADWLAEVHSVGQLTGLLELARDHDVPVTVLGGGSNVLVADAGVRGVVVRLKLTGIAERSPGLVRAEAGVTMNGLVRWTVSRGLAGLERWAGTPGTVGGAIHGNAHWAGRNIGDLVTGVQLVSVEGELRAVPREEMGFGYDTSRLQRTREIVVWAEFVVGPGEPAELRERARESLHYRKRTQPLAMPSAGCMFQNPDPVTETLPPEVPASAGALLDRAGLKGRRAGGARISDTHANFIVNDGGATAHDVRMLVEQARAAVRERYGVTLRDEIVYLGTF